MQHNQSISSPFREKIFSLMNQQQPSKILKLTQKLNNKTFNSSHSPFKQYSMNTDLAEDTKLSGLDVSTGVLHFKSVQEKLGLKNASNQKSRGKPSSSNSNERAHKKKYSGKKKVSFVQDSSKFYYKPSQSKSKQKAKQSVKKEFSKSNSSLNLKKHSNPKPKSIPKASLNTSLHKSQKNLKPFHTITQNDQKKPFSSTHQFFQSTDKQTQKKNYLLQTLKKMQSVRKNLTKTFQQFDRQNNSKTERSNEENKSKKISKSKTKSNLTVISDFVNEESESRKNYKMKASSSKQDKSKSKSRLFESTKKQEKHKSPTTDIFHKKTPTKNKYLMSQQSFTQKLQKFSSKKENLPIERNLLKQIIASCKHPQKWQTILQNELISIHFRVVKRKLIQIQIHAEQMLSNLQLQLQKGHFICQSLKEEYKNVKKKEIITLLCSVRGIDLNNVDLNLFLVPKLMISIETKLEQSSITFKKQVYLPYTWIMLLEKEKNEKVINSSSKKLANQSINRVKTRSTLQNLSLSKHQKYPNLLQILSFCQVQDSQISAKKQKQKKKFNSSTSKVVSSSSINKIQQTHNFTYVFQLQQQQFKLSVKINNDKGKVSKCSQKKTNYDIEIQGKGQALMGKMLLFLEVLR